jgi:hypothetical protein
MDIVIGNWLKGDSFLISSIFQSILNDSLVSKTVSKTINLEYISGIKYSTILFNSSITVREIHNKLDDHQCKLFLQNTELLPDHTFTSCATIIIIPIELIELSTDETDIDIIISHIQDNPCSSYNIHIFDTWSYLNDDYLYDFYAFKNVHTLTLNDCYNTTDIHELMNVHTLTINNLRDLTDVSALGSVHTLTLNNCRHISDVSTLGTVRNLTLCNCFLISDVSALGTVHNLVLDTCHNIADVSALGTVHNLILDDCYNITDISALGTVHNLTIRKCFNITKHN